MRRNSSSPIGLSFEASIFFSLLVSLLTGADKAQQTSTHARAHSNDSERGRGDQKGKQMNEGVVFGCATWELRALCCAFCGVANWARRTVSQTGRFRLLCRRERRKKKKKSEEEKKKKNKSEEEQEEQEQEELCTRGCERVRVCGYLCFCSELLLLLLVFFWFFLLLCLDKHRHERARDARQPWPRR